MPRKATWPPRIYVHVSGRPFIRVRRDGRATDYYLDGEPGSPECQAHYARLVLELSSGGAVRPEPSGPLTVCQLVDRWSAERIAELPRKEQYHYRHALTPLVELYGTIPVVEFRVRQLKVVRQAMVNLDWCRTYVNRQVSRVRALWRWGEESELVPSGSWHHLCTLRSLPKNAPNVRNTNPRHVTTREELNAVLAVLREPLKTMLEVQWFTGMRSCEVRLMAASRIDRSQGTWVYTPERDKSGWREGHAPRVVYLGPECQRLLAPWLVRAERDYLFPSQSRPYYGDSSYAREIRKVCNRIGVKLVPYGSRHAAKRRIAQEMGSEAAKAFLGHSSLSVTELYAREHDHKTAEEVARKLA